MSEVLTGHLVSGESSTLTYTSPRSESIRYQVSCKAPPETGNWSYTQLYQEDDAARKLFQQRLGAELAKDGFREVLAPTVRHMSGVILPPRSFTEEIPLGCGVVLKRPKGPCDGTRVTRPQPLSMSAAGCSLAVLVFGDVCLAAHAGRLSLIDIQFVHEEIESRTDFSVINALVKAGISMGGHPSEMTLRAFFGIPWQAHRFSTDDPIYGEKNFILVNYLQNRYGSDIIRLDDELHDHICPDRLIAAQARECGVGTIETDGFGLSYGGPHAYTTHANPRLGGNARNHVVISIL